MISATTPKTATASIFQAQGAQANPDNGLQGNTCYSPSREISADQAFNADRFAVRIFNVPEFDVCMKALSTQTGAALELAACDGSDAQNFTFAGEGKISPAANNGMFLTLGTNTRSGRSDTNQTKTVAGGWRGWTGGLADMGQPHRRVKSFGGGYFDPRHQPLLRLFAWHSML